MGETSRRGNVRISVTHTFDSAKQTRDRNFSRLACPSASHLVASNC